MQFFRNFFMGFGITLIVTKLIGFKNVWSFLVKVVVFIALLIVFKMLIQVIHIVLFQ